MLAAWLVFLLVICVVSGQKDIRISKGIGKRSYDSVRVSVITPLNSTQPSSSVFSYQQPFQYRWKQFYLSTGKYAAHVFTLNYSHSFALLIQVLSR